jgi:hypothetical protein
VPAVHTPAFKRKAPRGMTTTPNPPVTPASDEEVSNLRVHCDCRWLDGADRHSKNCNTTLAPRIIARIEAESKSNAELRAEVRKMFTEAHHGNKVMPDDPIQPITAHDFELIRGSFFVWCMRFVDGDMERDQALKERGYVPVLIEHIENQETELTALRSRLSRVEEAAHAVVANCNAPYDVQRETMHALESILSESEGVKS